MLLPRDSSTALAPTTLLATSSSERSPLLPTTMADPSSSNPPPVSQPKRLAKWYNENVALELENTGSVGVSRPPSLDALSLPIVLADRPFQHATTLPTNGHTSPGFGQVSPFALSASVGVAV